MRILMLTTNSSLLDGVNRHILNVAPALNAEKNIEVAVCTVNPSGGLNYSLKALGVKTYSLNCEHGHDFKIFHRFYAVMKDFRPNIVHSHVIALIEKIVLSVMFRKLKYVGTVHGISDKVAHETTRMKFERILDKLFAVPYSAICYISKGVRDAVIDTTLDSSRTPVIYNPINLEQNNHPNGNLRSILRIAKSSIVIGTACRIAQVKNPEIFTEVMCRVLVKQPNAHAVVMGDGDCTIKANCIKIVNKYNVDSRFHWLGFREDAPALVGELDCFVLTSTSEGMPTSLLECMASDTPFAFLRGGGGLKDLEMLNETEGEFCIIGDADNLNAFVKKISKLIDDKEGCRRNSQMARAVAEKYFSVDRICGKLIDIYSGIMK